MRWILRSVAALVVLGLVALGAVLAVPAEQIARLATDRLESATDRRVAVTGRVRATLYPSLGARVEGVEIGNADWVEEGPLLRAEALHIGVNWGALLRGEMRLDTARIEGPEILLLRAADGRASWDTGPADTGSDTAPTGGGWLASLGVDEAVIADGRLRYHDMATGQDLQLAALDLTLRLPDAGGAATATLSAEVNGTALSAEGRVDGLAGFLAGAVQPVAVLLTWDGGRAGFDGRFGLSPAAEGQIEIDADTLAPIFTIAGQTAPDLPQGLGRDRIALAGAVTLASEGSVHLREGVIELDGNRVTAALDILPGAERPRIRGTLRAAEMDLTALTAGADAPSNSTPGWSRTPIDASGLFAADAELSLVAGALDLGIARLAPVDLRASLDSGRLVLSLSQVGAYGGSLTGELVANGRGGFSTRGDLAFRNVQLSPLLTDLANYDRLQGSGDVTVQFLGIGNDMATLMSGLDGGGGVTFGAGAILGFDLAGMIRNFDPSFRGEGQRTVYDSLTATFTITEGVLSNRDLVLSAPWGQVTGAGSSDLGAQTLDYRVIPGLMQGEGGTGGLSVPILISGPWANLSFRPDLEYLAEQELAAERERLEAEARARLAEEQERIEQRLRDEVSDALGVDLDADQTRDEVENSLEDQLRREAEEQLRRLFD